MLTFAKGISHRKYDRLSDRAYHLRFKVINWHKEVRDFDSETFTATIKAPARTSPHLLALAVRHRYETHCTHSYDCCGNWYTTVWTSSLKRLKSGEWTIRMSHSMNC